MIWALVLTLLQAEDPRPSLVQLQLEGKIETALVAVEVALESHSDEARRLGFDYLQGHLLEAVGRRLDAHQAFVNAMGANPELRDYSRYRLAWNQYRLGHPEVAAGLLATLLAGDPPESLAPAATRLLVRSLAMGGDCRLLGGVQTWRLARRERRLVELAVADCAARLGDSRRARRLLLGLLEEGVNDDTARAAAERLVSLTSPTSSPPSTTLLLGLALHHHRDFEQATRFLEEGLATAPLEIPGQPEAERQQARYALARSYFWRGNYSAAAQRFGELAERGRKSEERARALYQQGRCYELDGDWAAASQSYRQVQQADLAGRWTAPALLSALRVEFRSGNENATLELLAHLKSRRQWRDMMARGALFLAASDLVRSRSDRAGSWLALAGRGRGSVPVEVAYWRGRLAETQEQPIAAARWYLAALLADLYHPLSQEARQRLASTPLAESAHSEGLRLAASENNRDLYGAWVLLGETDATGQAARRHLEKHLGQRSRSRDFLEMEVVPPQEWPLWQGPLRQPEELLLALGIVEEGTSVIQHHFPVSQISLGFTGSRVLARAGLTRPSLYQAEILLRRVPNDLPLELLPVGYQQLLYPLPYRNLILQQAQRFDVNPMLLAAIIREESRFDPHAISAASARGLTQFVLPTAKRLISEIQIERLEAEDLHRPEISIALGAAYLAELDSRYAGDQFQMIAAYNAGEDQARVWRSYCYSREPAEYYSKVGFSQTREYIRNVLSSRARYQDLYGSTGE